MAHDQDERGEDERGDALHASFEAAREADLDAVPEREARKWFTYTVVGIAVYAAVVIVWIYL